MGLISRVSSRTYRNFKSSSIMNHQKIDLTYNKIEKFLDYSSSEDDDGPVAKRAANITNLKQSAEIDNSHSAIEIDGAMMEGGGQVIRISTAMSVIQGRDLKITNIRGGRPKPGLARQHACGVEAACKLRNGITHKGVEIGSQSLEINCNNLIAMTAVRENVVEHIDIKSAGSISLVLQTIVPILVECENSLVQIKGGTRVDFAPWVDYFNMVFLKMSKLDKIFKLETIKQGFNPVGGGLIKLHRKSVYFDISSLSYSYLDAGKPDKLELYCFGSGSLSNSCDQIVGLVNLKLQNYGLTVPKESVFQKQYNDKCNVLGCLLIVKTSTGMVKACSKLGNMNKNRKFNYGFFVDDLILKFVRKCVQSEACCDDNMTDQLLVFMAMGGEQSVIRVNYPLSLHAETAIVLIQKFLPERKFKVLPDERGAGEQPTARVFCMDVDKEHLVDYDN